MKNTLKIVASLALIAGLAACGGGGASAGSAASTGSNSGSSSVTALQTIDTVVGTGATAQAGNTVTVNYTGWLYNSSAANYEGTEFDSSAAHGSTFTFLLGAGQVIPGWDQGVVGMKVGGTRTLIIPASLAYGATGSGPIPPNAALVFSVQLVSVQ
ncbi:MAG: FKBP-type peptidyl-prolyl cis-trans isomerase [Burkholderiaceae bacterium]|nr:FKBP-type peptidyl-prolyl cis-trans isomerase [Burkholderiaceae bacterium]